MILLAACAAAYAMWVVLSGATLDRLRAPQGRRPRWTGMTTWARHGWRQVVAHPSRRGRRRQASEVAWTCELLALTLDAGAPTRLAASHVAAVATGPIREDLSRVLHQMELGVEESEAWRTLVEVDGLHRVAKDVSRAITHGSSLAPLLRRLAVDSRRDAQAQALASARIAGVHSVIPLVVCFLPAFLLLGVVPVLAGTLLGLRG